jgi:hypothetical protein
MAVLRALACAGVAATSLALPVAAEAGSTATCAQRVIRDWYAGGRVDGAYPLGCYRAAIRALPEDVLQYSNARNEIERALAYARQGLPTPVRGRAEAPAAAPAEPDDRRGTRRSEFATRSRPTRAGLATPTTVRAFDGPVHLAARDDALVADARGLPYPVIALATLAALLLATAAAARLMTRRRGPEGPSDR